MGSNCKECWQYRACKNERQTLELREEQIEARLPEDKKNGEMQQAYQKEIDRLRGFEIVAENGGCIGQIAVKETLPQKAGIVAPDLDCANPRRTISAPINFL